MIGFFLSRTLCDVVGTVYPTYASYRAVLSSSPQEHKQWLTYWLAFAVFTVAETLGDALLPWVPLYYEAKIAALVWLSAMGGAAQLYNALVARLLEKYEGAIDEKLGALHAAAADAASGAAQTGVAALQGASTQVASTGLQWLAQANMAGAAMAAAAGNRGSS